FSTRMIIYLTRISPSARYRKSAVRDRRYSDRGATVPEGCRTGCPPSVLSCTAWGFSCLANYSASGELLPRLFTLACPIREAVSFPYSRSCQRTGGVFSVTLSVNARFRECCPRILRGMLPYGVRTFLQRA